MQLLCTIHCWLCCHDLSVLNPVVLETGLLVEVGCLGKFCQVRGNLLVLLHANSGFKSKNLSVLCLHELISGFLFNFFVLKPSGVLICVLISFIFFISISLAPPPSSCCCAAHNLALLKTREWYPQNQNPKLKKFPWWLWGENKGSINHVMC